MKLTHIAQRTGRLSTFLKNELGLSTGLMNRLKWQEKLFVNDIPRHADYPVNIGDKITAVLDDPLPDYPPEDLPLEILYEDEHLLAVDKPAGMLIHPSAHRNTGTLANRVIAYYQKTGQNCAFHPITRLDRDTYGIVLLAKNAHIHMLLNKQHAEGKLQKTYHALVFGAPESGCGIIDAPIARCPLPSLLRQVHPEGKPAVTQYQILEKQELYTKLALSPITGRTHQLRLHCLHAGFPILGDPQYTTDQAREFSDQLGLKSQILCAYSLEFFHPITQTPLFLSSLQDADIRNI